MFSTNGLLSCHSYGYAVLVFVCVDLWLCRGDSERPRPHPLAEISEFNVAQASVNVAHVRVLSFGMFFKSFFANTFQLEVVASTGLNERNLAEPGGNILQCNNGGVRCVEHGLMKWLLAVNVSS